MGASEVAGIGAGGLSAGTRVVGAVYSGIGEDEIELSANSPAARDSSDADGADVAAGTEVDSVVDSISSEEVASAGAAAGAKVEGNSST